MIKAKFTNKVKEQIYERDNRACIICHKNNDLHFHHCFFGTQSNYGKDRNAVDQGVTICSRHHSECHGCAKGKSVRQFCIDYLNNLTINYEGTTKKMGMTKDGY